MRPVFRTFAVALSLSLAAASGYADSITVSMVGPFSPTGMGDLLEYNLQFTTFNAPTTLMQTGTLTTAAGSGSYGFSFVDAITINGMVQDVSFHGTATLSTGGVETLMTDATGPITYGNLLLNVPSSTFSGIGSVPVSLTGNITAMPEVPPPPPSPVPEPSSIALLGTGVLAAAGAARRRFLKG